MGISKSADIEDYVGDSGDYEGPDLDELLTREALRKRDRKAQKLRNPGSWRAIEDYLENKRLDRQLREFYDED